MRTCSLGYCADIVWLSIIVIWSLCLTLWKSHFIFSLGFNLFCALRKFFHSVTFTAAFSAFFFLFSNGAQRHNTSRRAFFFHFHLKMETLKIHPYHRLPIEQTFPFGSCGGEVGTTGHSGRLQRLPQCSTVFYTNQQCSEDKTGAVLDLSPAFSLQFPSQDCQIPLPRAASPPFPPRETRGADLGRSSTQVMKFCAGRSQGTASSVVPQAPSSPYCVFPLLVWFGFWFF